MVPQLDNDVINVRSRSNHNLEGHSRPLTPGEQLIAIIQQLAVNDEELSRILQRDQIDVDIHLNESGATGIITLTDQLRVPIMVTDVIATWNLGTQTDALQPNPGAGVNFTYTNNTGGFQTIVGIDATFTSDATVGNRFLNAQIVDASGNQLYKEIDFTGVPASTVIQLIAFVGGTQAQSSSGNTIVPLPADFTIPPGGKLLMGSGAIGPADAWTNITLTFAAQAPIVTIQIDDRIFQPNSSAGQFILSSVHGMQLPIHKTVKMTTTPPTACFFSILGYADPRKIDRL